VDLLDPFTALAVRAVEHDAQQVQADVQGHGGEAVAAVLVDRLEILEHVVAVELGLPARQDVALERDAVEDRRGTRAPRRPRSDVGDL